MQTLGVDTETMRVEMARAKVGSTALARSAGVHRNCVNNILRTGRADLDSIGVITSALNDILRQGGYADLGPYGLLKQIPLPTQKNEAQP
jgi:hypothetical protein